MRGFLGQAGEAKYFDTANVLALNTTGTLNHIDIVPTGTTVNSRDGKNYTITSVQIRGNVVQDTTAATNNVAMYLVWDKQPNKALAAITDILDTSTTLSFIKRENAQRFQIIKKWRYALSGNAGTPTAGMEIYDVDDYIKLPRGLTASCTTADTTGAIGNRVTGALLLVGVGNTASGTTDAVGNINARVNFMDA